MIGRKRYVPRTRPRTLAAILSHAQTDKEQSLADRHIATAAAARAHYLRGERRSVTWAPPRMG